mgnify:CR=1 FL=1
MCQPSQESHRGQFSPTTSEEEKDNDNGDDDYNNNNNNNNNNNTVTAAAITVAATPVETVAQIKTNTFPQDLNHNYSPHHLYLQQNYDIKTILAMAQNLMDPDCPNGGFISTDIEPYSSYKKKVGFRASLSLTTK